MDYNIEKIKLSEIIEKLNKRNSQSAKDVVLKSIQFKNHVSYVIKEVTAKNIIQIAHFTYPKDVNVNDMSDEQLSNIKPVPNLNRSKQYILTAVMIVDLFTNIEIDFSNAMVEYDKLIEYGLLEYMLNNINESEIKEFNMLIDYEYEKYYHKYYSIQSYFDKKINELKLEAIDFMNCLFQGMQGELIANEDKIKELINNIPVEEQM